MDDITFCLSDCQRTDCFRHPSNIQDRTIPHSYAEFKGTETCPEKMQLSDEDATKDATFDCIIRRAAINAMWKALHEYEDNTEKQFQESDELDVDDWIVHRGFVQDMNDIDRQTILNLPSVQPESSEYEELDFVKEHERIPVTLTVQPQRMRGRWVYLDYGGVGNYHCTACRRICVNKGDYDFCPFCGADMRGTE